MLTFFHPSGKITRKTFAIAGLIFFAIKYNIDRVFAITMGRNWFITDYFMQPDHIAIGNLSKEDMHFYLLLLFISLPFIWTGVTLCLKRLRDAGLPSWLVVCFFLPFINFFFFMILSLLPSESKDKEDHKPRFIYKLIPKSESGSIFFAITITLLFALLLTAFSLQVMAEYGWGLFVGIPFFTGFCSVLLYAYHHQPVTFKKAITIGITSISFFALLIFILAMEGLICIAMAAPIAIPIGVFGSVLAYTIQSHSPKATLNCFAGQALLLPLVMIIEQQNSRAPVYEIKTEVIINENRQIVWDNLVDFNTIDKPTEFLFKTGIAYPTDAQIMGSGVGAVRKCNFTTGSFVEPITTWQEPELMRFDVLEQPQPMFELSMYNEVKAVHLNEYFLSVRGQFKLTKLEDGNTLLEGTTWYTNRMWPMAYWKVWSDYILHKIHYRVLNHIKKNAEHS